MPEGKLNNTNEAVAEHQKAVDWKRTEERRDIPPKITRLIDECMRLGLYRTMHRLKDAQAEIGWELAGVPMPDEHAKRLYSETMRLAHPQHQVRKTHKGVRIEA